jgi:hypothetical protein
MIRGQADAGVAEAGALSRHRLWINANGSARLSDDTAGVQPDQYSN